MSEETTQPAKADPAPAAPGISPTEYAKALSKTEQQQSTIDALKAQLGDLQRVQSEREQASAHAGSEAAKAAKAKAAARAEQTKSQLAAAELAANTAWDVAKQAMVKAALTDIKNPAYLKLVPGVELNEQKTGLTDDSLKALDAFRAEHPDLFARAGPMGSTPVSNAPGAGVSAVDAETLRGWGLNSVDPDRSRQQIRDGGKENLIQILGWSAPNKLQGKR